MNKFRLYKEKVYYLYANSVLCTKPIVLPGILSNKKNIFIYFDYEREFGGHETKINDLFIKEILELLSQYQIKSTWFTVGKVIKYYPSSINSILVNGHEIGSHTFFHKSPLLMKHAEMENDFEQFSIYTKHFAKVRGFHSPQGRWDLRIFPFLLKYDFYYDLAGGNKMNNGMPVLIRRNGRKILRFSSAGDDWPMYVGNHSLERVCEYLTQLVNDAKTGGVAGIGFHPWILFEKPLIMAGLEYFFQHISQLEDVNVLKALDYVQIISNETNDLEKL